MKKTIFPNKQPFFTKEGDLFVPEMISPHDSGLTSSESYYLMILAASKGDLKVFKKHMSGKGGSRTTLWRIKKSLERKGYL